MTEGKENACTHPGLPLLAVERTGWRRWVFGRWVYSSEPFRRDIQRKCTQAAVVMHLHPWERIHDPSDPLDPRNSKRTSNAGP